MKKTLLAILALTAPLFPALAADTVGDSVTLLVNGMKEGKPMTGTVTFEIVDEKPFENLYLIRLTERIAGEQEKQEENWRTNEEFSSAADVEGMIKGCDAYEGRIEEITVAAGTFRVCTMPLFDDRNREYGKLSMGQVPFGTVRLEANTREGRIVTELQSFQKK